MTPPPAKPPPARVGSQASPRRNIAVIGGGIAGMSAAHALAETHAVTLFETEPRLGGHARTVLAGQAGDQPVDTGFIVFNRPNYPNLTALFEELAVPVAPADMSFSVSLNGGGFEYALKAQGALRGLFGQPSNVLRPRFLAMLRDILRFNAHARQAAEDPSLTLGDLLDTMRMGPWMRDRFLLPLAGAIWSSPSHRMLDFPAKGLVTFLDNHGLLTHGRHPQWFSVAGGSAVYVERLQASLAARGVTLRTGTPVAAVRREAEGAALQIAGAWQRFDAVVLACHADQALGLLTDPTDQERRTLGAIPFQPNTAVLHADPALMPVRRACWAAWNHIGATSQPEAAASVTYWMNALQTGIPRQDPLFVSLNPCRPINPALIHDTVVFRHPLYDHRSARARREIDAANGTRNTWFCGAWMGNGFHEDGIASARTVAERLNAPAPQEASNRR